MMGTRWARVQAAEAPVEFSRTLAREVLRTQQLRVKVLMATAAVLFVLLLAVRVVAPEIVQGVWHDPRKALLILGLLVLFILFEWWVHAQLGSYLAENRDPPPARRYVGALIETSFPTVVLILQIGSMGPERALGFVLPFTYFIFIIISTLRLDFALSAFTGAVAAGELLATALIYLPAASEGQEGELYVHFARSAVILICGVLAGAVGVQLRRQFAASIAAATARDRVTDLFGQHVSPQVVERLMKEGSAEPRDLHEVAVMFVDFRGFTSAAQSRSPQDVVTRLDGAFAVLVDILERHGGIVNKFLGDGFLALFGAPFPSEQAASQAVAAAREMLAAMEAINAGSDWPLRIGIGVHVGEVVAGSIGSPRRKEYTVIGDTVNFASRLEALNKELGSQLVISSQVHAALGEAGQDAVSCGPITVRGYDHAVEMWRLG